MCGNMEIVKDIILTKQAKLLQQTDKRWAQLGIISSMGETLSQI
jgi:hypothetical protein